MRFTLALAAAAIFACCLPVSANEGTGHTFTPKDCEQEDSHVTALRACTALLDAGGLDDATRERYLTRRGHAWLADDDGADAAVEDFTTALKITPNDIKALKGRAKAYTQLGQHDKAVGDFTTILATNPAAQEQEAILMERGASELAAGQHEAALADYAKVLELNPKSEKAHMARADVHAALNDREKALKEYELARAINGGSYDYYLARAIMAERWGDKQSAIENYAAALKIDPRKAWDARKSLRRLGVDHPSE